MVAERITIRRSQATAFTLVELLMIVAIIALLLAILMPSLASSRKATRRLVCQNNQVQLAKSSLLFSNDNSGEVIPCRYRSVQICFSNGDVASTSRVGDNNMDVFVALEQYGLVINKKDPSGRIDKTPSEVFNCPDRRYKTQWEGYSTPYQQLVIAYQYFGGIDTWYTPKGTFKSCSPTNVYTANPRWIFVADTTMKIDGEWGGGRATAYLDMPAHGLANGEPEGGNQVYTDGAVEWMPFEKMVRLHSWGGWARQAFGWQSDWGDYKPDYPPH